MITARCYRCDGDGSIEIENVPGAPEDVECVVCKGDGRQSEIVYANVYAVDRIYGGPEEGGWWYDAGHPLGSVRVNPRWNRDLVVAMLRELYEDEQGRAPRYSTIGGPDVEVYFESHFAEPWPARRPHYE